MLSIRADEFKKQNQRIASQLVSSITGDNCETKLGTLTLKKFQNLHS